MIEDRASILMAVTETMRRVAGNMLNTKRASLLLYALQVANSNLPRQAPDKQSVVSVEEMTQDAELGALAPEAAFFLPKPTKSARQIAEEFEEQTVRVRLVEPLNAPPPNTQQPPDNRTAASPLFYCLRFTLGPGIQI